TYTCTLSLHDALPICGRVWIFLIGGPIHGVCLDVGPNSFELALVSHDTVMVGVLPQLAGKAWPPLQPNPEDVVIGRAILEPMHRSEEHTSELQSRENL